MTTALTHINFDVVQRSRGQCAVKIMAYDMCTAMTKHDGTSYNFGRKESELVHAEVMLPEGAPVSLLDPEALANACELSEKRSDSQTGRLLLVTCPRECPEHLRIPLARTIVQPYVEQGMGVAWAYHNSRGADGGEQPHFHCFLTTRRVTPEGLASKKSPEWDRQFREKVPASPDDPKPKSGTAERQRICDRANTYFARHDLQIRLDPRRLEQQGIDRPPEPDAPRKSWQQWQREGANPEMAPAPVAAVLKHRELREELRKHEDYQQRIAMQIAADTRAISLANDKRKIESTKPKSEKTKMIPWEQDNEGYDPLLPDEKYRANMAFQKFKKSHPDKAEMDISAFVRMRQAEFAKSKKEETKMEKAVPKRSSKDRHENVRPEPWMSQQGGADALSKLHRESAWRSYERWIERGGGLGHDGDKLSFEGYVAFVQEQVARKGLSEGYDNAKPPSKTVRPRSADAALRERVSHVYRLLAERYAVPDELVSFVSYLDVNRKNGEAVLSIKGGGHIVDTGDLLRSIDEDITADLAAATVATAHARGWTSLTVTGSDDYRHAIARAAALHEPPISTDVELPREVQHEIQAALVERAKAALKDTANSVAPATKTLGQPALSAAQLQATAMLDRAQARQQAELAGEPKGLLDAKALAEPRIAELQTQLEAARLAAEEARQAVDEHAREFPRVRRLLDSGARTRHAALDAEAARLEKVADKLQNGHKKTVDRIKAEAAREAKAAQRSHDDWRYQPQIRRAQRNIADIERLRVAVAAGDNTILEAINSGKITGAVSKLLEFESSQMQKARAARTPEQIRGQAIDRAFAEADKSARNPERKEQAMEAMRAASDGDAATIAALDAGKIDEALKAAAAWRKKLDDEAAAVKRAEQEKKETLERRLDPPQMAMPQP